MNQEVLNLLLTASGGTAVIIGGLSAWLGKVWANRLQESEKSKYAVEIENLKSSLAISQAQAQRNSDAQFKLYSELWNQLQDLKVRGDFLWQEASIENYQSFIGALFHADIAIEKGRLILTERDYLRLRQAIDVFQRYQLGKQMLMEIRTSEQLEENYNVDSRDRINRQIRQNRQHKEYYEQILEELVGGFRRRLGLDA